MHYKIAQRHQLTNAPRYILGCFWAKGGMPRFVKNEAQTLSFPNSLREGYFRGHLWHLAFFTCCLLGDVIVAAFTMFYVVLSLYYDAILRYHTRSALCSTTWLPRRGLRVVHIGEAIAHPRMVT
jgi:hypothetical protein